MSNIERKNFKVALINGRTVQFLRNNYCLPRIKTPNLTIQMKKSMTTKSDVEKKTKKIFEINFTYQIAGLKSHL